MTATQDVANPSSLDADHFRKRIEHYVRYHLGKPSDEASRFDAYMAAALALREEVIDRMLATEKRVRAHDAKRVYYLSMEFLIGRSLGNNLFNLGHFDAFSVALGALGFDLEEIREMERDAALGNGGLGRLAACFLDSMATLDIPGYGYGINYEYGLFRQTIDEHGQREQPDAWARERSPWLIDRPGDAVLVPLYGRIEHATDRDGGYNPMWMDWQVVVGTPRDLPIVGYGGHTVNWLRLFAANASDDFDMSIFNSGDYLHAVEQKISSEKISKVLYPEDSIEAGRELRLVQEYFLVTCSMRDIAHRFADSGRSIDQLADAVAIQMNDTHPALAVAELMRHLVDEHSLPWEQAWGLTRATLAYTNHTLLPEALETWSEDLLEKVLPRHIQVIREINDRFLEEVELSWPDDEGERPDLSILGGDGQVRMANLAIVGSHSVNGVAELHSTLIKNELVPGFHTLWPGKFNNKTNGVTQRRWLLKANPGLARLLSETVGDAWITHYDALRALEPLTEDHGFLDRLRAVKQANKQGLADYISDKTGDIIDPSSMFDMQAKRIHEYKRQLLLALNTIDDYLEIVECGHVRTVPRTVLVAGKAAPGYHMAKLVIRLLHELSIVINNDARVHDQLKVVFVPDYRVSLAERMIPAADLSEQISTAGKEASGTGNMKFAMNGALTIGTWDGANIEMAEEIGHENMFIFGLRAEEIAAYRERGDYDPSSLYKENARIRRALDALKANRFCEKQPGLFQPLFDTLTRDGDQYFLLADFAEYIDTQREVDALYRDRTLWGQKSLLNIARMGRFSSDRTILEYAHDIWGARRLA